MSLSVGGVTKGMVRYRQMDRATCGFPLSAYPKFPVKILDAPAMLVSIRLEWTHSDNAQSVN